MAFDIRVVKISDADGGGELRVLEQFRHLPDDYIVIIGAVIGDAQSERSQEIDAILIGPPGIFVFEVKNWKGAWSGTPTHWYRDIERKPSPISSARLKWEMLKDWLRKNHGFFVSRDPLQNYWIDYGVILPHPTCDTSGVQDPSKSKYLFRLDDVSHNQLDKVFRHNSAKRIDDYYEARTIADKICTQAASELLAIDFGTTYSLVSMYTPEGSPHIFKDAFNSSLIPSVFGFQDKKEYVGRKALYAISSNRLRYSNYVSSIKTFLGVTEGQYSKMTSRLKPSNSSFDKDGLTVRLDRRRFTATEIAGKILQHLRDIAKQHTNRDWTQAVISVPARFTHEQRSALCHAAKAAGFATVSLIDEPTAAALAFGMIHKYTGSVAVYDLGGGTFDFSILDISNGACRERAKIGRLIGGDDFDHRLFADSKQFFNQTGSSTEMMENLSDREQYLLLDSCEKAKIALSGDDEATIFLDNWRGTLSLNRRLERPDFDLLIEDLVRQTLDTCKEGLEDAGDVRINDVLLVGGSTFIPLVRKKVSEFFGLSIRSDVDANTAIVHGAAIKAGMLMGRVGNAIMMSRVSQVTIGIPTVYPFAWWSPSDQAIVIAPIRERCSDPKLLRLRERLLAIGGSARTLAEIQSLVQDSGVRSAEYFDGNKTIFCTEYNILYPIIGRSEMIEVDGVIVDFTHTFFTMLDSQPSVELIILETLASKRQWQTEDECTKLLERDVKLKNILPAGQNGVKVVCRFDRDGKLRVQYTELADDSHNGEFAVDLLYREAAAK